MHSAKQFFYSTLTLGCFIVLLNFSCNNKKEIIEIEGVQLNNKYVELSFNLLQSVKQALPYQQYSSELAELNPDTLASYLISDTQKKAFWINIYNANIQILLAENPDLFNNRGSFFSTKKITIAQEKLSFDDIEHGIIRSSKIKLSLGLVRNPFANEFEKRFRTNKTDGRVHFALNCGAKSCPLVAVYDAKTFDQKIDEVAKSFLLGASKYDETSNTVTTTALFSWFRGDFGGKKGVLQMLKKYNIIEEQSAPEIAYADYDWTLSLGNYYEE